MRSFIVFSSCCALALLALAAPANAAPSESGTQYCQPGSTPRADARAYGYLDLKGPGDAFATSYNLGPNYTTRTETGPGGYWVASINVYGDVDTAATRGRCIPGALAGQA